MQGSSDVSEIEQKFVYCRGHFGFPLFWAALNRKAGSCAEDHLC